MCKRAVIFAALSLLLASNALAQCTKIKDGTILDAKGNVITLGFDKYGYNYQAHLFNGLSGNYTRPDVVVAEGPETLVMKWSDDWLANVDCNSDGRLDRGLDPKTGGSDGTSKGWVTNHYEGDYTGSDGESHHYTYFAKIVWVGPAPVNAVDPWADARIWGQYAVIEELQNDAFGELGVAVPGYYNGKFRSKLTAPGLGLL